MDQGLGDGTPDVGLILFVLGALPQAIEVFRHARYAVDTGLERVLFRGVYTHCNHDCLRAS